MTKTKHTSGPWHYDDGEGGKYFPHVSIGPIRFFSDGKSPRGYIVVNDCEPGSAMALHQANARLIAAAPDLLAACEAVMDGDEQVGGTCSFCLYEENGHKHTERCPMTVVARAVAKAKGDT